MRMSFACVSGIFNSAFRWSGWTTFARMVPWHTLAHLNRCVCSLQYSSDAGANFQCFKLSMLEFNQGALLLNGRLLHLKLSFNRLGAFRYPVLFDLMAGCHFPFFGERRF